MEKTLQVIEEMTRLGVIEAGAIGEGIAATYYIEPVLTYDLDLFFIPGKSGLDELSPIYDFARSRGYVEQAEALIIEGFPVQSIPAYNDLVREAVAEATTLTYRGVKAKVVRAEHLAAITMQTGRAKDRERVVRLLDGDAVDRAVLAGILEKHGLAEKLKKIEGGTDEKQVGRGRVREEARTPPPAGSIAVREEDRDRRRALKGRRRHPQGLRSSGLAALAARDFRRGGPYPRPARFLFRALRTGHQSMTVPPASR